ncbi:MAG: putative RNA polymerase sigma factor FecI [Paracidovorax wautersii]|uniref:Putative RNA polymerase sigma factor FecI n=1 Tax=Paracidovorax wautersii TaxID=1177982 RepID=A0A7V8FQD0_9BURK|nr:MAG: putative RNA polymerase sigma factor FecI [Paracidovorax wautersii]
MTASLISSNACVESLYHEHHGWLRGWLRQRLNSTSDAADLAHDTFVNVIASGMAARIVEPRPFLVTVARRLVIQQHRRRQLERAYLDALAALPEELAPSPEQGLVALQSLQALDEALDAISPRARQAFLLAHLQELSYAEIAARLRVSCATVKRDLAAAHRQCFFVALS